MSSAWQFAILGPLEVQTRGRVIRIKSEKQRGVLGMLLLAANHVVATEALVDGLWGDDPPPTAVAALQVHVGKLRQALDASDAAAPIATRAPGYVIEVDDDALDLARYESLARRGREHLAEDRPAEASSLLRRALGIWRGAALADLVGSPFANAAVVRLEEERLAVLSDRLDADLGRGAHREIVGELRELTKRHPMRERYWEQLMLALYRCGDQADALAAYQAARVALRDELGLEPGAALRALEDDVLNQSPSLDLARRPELLAAPIATTIYEASARQVRGFLESADGRVELPARATLGRHPSSTIVIDDARASRSHAAIRANETGFVLHDLDSTNGTFVNNERVTEAELVDGDVIVIGATELVYRVDDE